MASSIFQVVVAVHLPLSRDESAFDFIRALFGDGDLVGMHFFASESDFEYFRDSGSPLGICQKLLQFGALLLHHYRVLVSLCLLDAFSDKGNFRQMQVFKLF